MHPALHLLHQHRHLVTLLRWRPGSVVRRVVRALGQVGFCGLVPEVVASFEVLGASEPRRQVAGGYQCLHPPRVHTS